MTAQNNPHIAGFCARLAEPFSIDPWKPLSRAAVEALPPLPPPLVRGWELEKPASAPAASLPAPPLASPAAPRESEPPFSLKEVAAHQLAPFLAKEHPQTIALTLSQLDPTQAASILAHLPEGRQADVAYRIATLESVPAGDLKRLEEGLEMSLRDILASNKDVGGPKVVADILNLSGPSVEKRVLEQLDAQGPQVAEAVRNLMFVFADIVKLTDRDIQILLREVDQKDLVVALKAVDEELKQKILANISEQVRALIAEEMEFLGPMRLSEVEQVQLRIVQQVRQLEEKGQITVVRGAVVDWFV
ncbi:MAG: hypothetical protein HYW07_21760 [Candidatus Latescibacteria bacterium]|nr:hypothetical protein [Candidatus Latescibacterota bacterium]